MTPLVEIYLFVVLAFVIIIQGIERFIFSQEQRKEKEKLLDEISRLVKAVIAKNANEYVMTASIDKVAPEPQPQLDTDEVLEENLSDEEFMQAIGKAKPKK